MPSKEKQYFNITLNSETLDALEEMIKKGGEADESN